MLCSVLLYSLGPPKQKYQKKGTVEEFKTVTFKDDLISDIYTLKDLKKKQNYICVQDTKNHLYLLNENSSVLFDIPLKKPIVGAPQILSLKNSKAKIAFVTESSLYLVNTNGENLKGFPKQFKDKITQPVSVFNYENDRNFRIVITQQSELFMYDMAGKLVKGFKPKKEAGEIKQAPKHFRISKKDYIVFPQGNQLKIVNRRGQSRIRIKTPIQFSKNKIYNYKNSFCTTNSLGQFIQVSTNQKLTRKNINLNENHNFTATLNTIVTFNDNQLNIKTKTVEMPYSLYTHPEIFYLKDKIYVSITDLQNQKVHLFDSQGKSIPNFPVYGTSAAILQYSESKRALQLVTKSDDNSLLYYLVN